MQLPPILNDFFGCVPLPAISQEYMHELNSEREAGEPLLVAGLWKEFEDDDKFALCYFQFELDEAGTLLARFGSNRNACVVPLSLDPKKLDAQLLHVAVRLKSEYDIDIAWQECQNSLRSREKLAEHVESVNDIDLF